MKVIVVEADKQPEIIEVENNLKTLQELVGGRIQSVPFEEDCIILVDEEGLIKGLPFNCTLDSKIDLFGTVVMVGVDGEEFTDVPQLYIDQLF